MDSTSEFGFSEFDSEDSWLDVDDNASAASSSEDETQTYVKRFTEWQQGEFRAEAAGMVSSIKETDFWYWTTKNSPELRAKQNIVNIFRCREILMNMVLVKCTKDLEDRYAYTFRRVKGSGAGKEPGQSEHKRISDDFLRIPVGKTQGFFPGAAVWLSQGGVNFCASHFPLPLTAQVRYVDREQIDIVLDNWLLEVGSPEEDMHRRLVSSLPANSPWAPRKVVEGADADGTTQVVPAAKDGDHPRAGAHLWRFDLGPHLNEHRKTMAAIEKMRKAVDDVDLQDLFRSHGFDIFKFRHLVLTGGCPDSFPPHFGVELSISDAQKKLMFRGIPRRNERGEEPPKPRRFNRVVPAENTSNADFVRLDDSQRAAAENALRARVHLMQGPPGTGKTTTICAMTERIVKEFEKNRSSSSGERRCPVLLAADSNAAVNAMFRGLLEKTCIRSILRVGGDYSLQPDQKKFTLQRKLRRMPQYSKMRRLEATARQLFLKGELEEADRLRGYAKFLQKQMTKQILDGADVVLASFMSCGSNKCFPGNYAFQTVITDEASQATEPRSLCAVARCHGQLILVGDHKQLPPVVKAEDPPALREGLSVSLFERLRDLATQCGWPAECTSMLMTNYRMHPQIRQWPSNQFYENKIMDADCVAEPRIPAWDVSYPDPTRQAVHFVDTGLFAGAGENEDRDRMSAKNQVEARLVVHFVTSLLKQQFDPTRVCIISPYNGQVRLLKKLLEKELTPEVAEKIRVGSVDSFQGSENDIIVLSFVRSRELGFLVDPRRLNVALTRAKRMLVAFGDRALLRRSSVFRSWLDYVDGLPQRSTDGKGDRNAFAEAVFPKETFGRISNLKISPALSDVPVPVSFRVDRCLFDDLNDQTETALIDRYLEDLSKPRDALQSVSHIMLRHVLRHKLGEVEFEADERFGTRDGAKQVGDEFETAFQDRVLENPQNRGVAWRTEKQLQQDLGMLDAQGNNVLDNMDVAEKEEWFKSHRNRILATPDFLFDAPGVLIGNRRVRWVDCKATYGSAALLLAGLKQGLRREGHFVNQILKYQRAYGPGAVVFKHGFSEGFAEALAPRLECTHLDDGPLLLGPLLPAEGTRAGTRNVFSAFLQTLEDRAAEGGDVDPITPSTSADNEERGFSPSGDSTESLFDATITLGSPNSAQVCRFGDDCKRPDCNFEHPGRKTWKEEMAEECRYGVSCKRPGCWFRHSCGRGPGIVCAPVTRCYFRDSGGRCTNPDCRYCCVHPESPVTAAGAIATKNEHVLVVRDLRQKIDGHVRSVVSDAEFLAHFKQFGNCISARVKRDRAGENRGFGFVHFGDAAAAQRAVDAPFQPPAASKPCPVSFKTGAAALPQTNAGELRQRRFYRMPVALDPDQDSTLHHVRIIGADVAKKAKKDGLYDMVAEDEVMARSLQKEQEADEKLEPIAGSSTDPIETPLPTEEFIGPSVVDAPGCIL